MKAHPTAQTALLELQAQDALIAQLHHRKNNLPEIAAIVELEKKFKELDGQRIEHDTAVSDLSRAQKKADSEVEQVKARRARDEERLNSGAVSNPKDLSSLQHELVALERRIATLEDEELEVMQNLEEAQARLANVQVDLDAVRGELDRKISDRDTALSVIDQQVTEAEAERGISAVGLPDDLLGLYDKIRSQYGIGAAALRARRCEGCRLELNGADLRELAVAPEDEVLRCPECSRILVRTPESGL